MKKIFIAMMVVLCSVQFAGAQMKSEATIKKNVEKAEADVSDPKKAESVAAWIKLGNAYVEAYNNPRGEGWIGGGRQELNLVLGNDKPTSSEYVSLMGQNFVKEVYATRNYYYDDFGLLQIIEVTRPVYEDALMSALDAYRKAYEIDVKASKTKEIQKGIGEIATMFKTDAYQKYMLGDIKGSLEYFECAADASEGAPLFEVDTISIYSAGIMAISIGDLPKAVKYLEKTKEVCYYDDGELFSRLGDVYGRLGDKEKSREVLEEGFLLFPEHQGICYSLINYYLGADEGTERLFDILNQAKASDPDNVIYYYIEGNIHAELGDVDEAIAIYNKAIEVDPTYEYSYIGLGIIYYNTILKGIAEKADEAELVGDKETLSSLEEQFNEVRLVTIDYFERAFEITEDNEVKVSLAQFLKELYFRIREIDDKYMAAYEKYNDIYVNGL